MRVVEMLMLVLGAIVIFMWVILAHPTPDEQARVTIRWVRARVLRGDSMDRERRIVHLTRVPR